VCIDIFLRAISFDQELFLGDELLSKHLIKVADDRLGLLFLVMEEHDEVCQLMFEGILRSDY
jgi:hypothetical protein